MKNTILWIIGVLTVAAGSVLAWNVIQDKRNDDSEQTEQNVSAESDEIDWARKGYDWLVKDLEFRGVGNPSQTVNLELDDWVSNSTDVLEEQDKGLVLEGLEPSYEGLLKLKIIRQLLERIGKENGLNRESMLFVLETETTNADLAEQISELKHRLERVDIDDKEVLSARRRISRIAAMLDEIERLRDSSIPHPGYDTWNERGERKFIRARSIGPLYSRIGELSRLLSDRDVLPQGQSIAKTPNIALMSYRDLQSADLVAGYFTQQNVRAWSFDFPSQKIPLESIDFSIFPKFGDTKPDGMIDDIEQYFQEHIESDLQESEKFGARYAQQSDRLKNHLLKVVEENKEFARALSGLRTKKEQRLNRARQKENDGAYFRRSNQMLDDELGNIILDSVVEWQKCDISDTFIASPAVNSLASITRSH